MDFKRAYFRLFSFADDRIEAIDKIIENLKKEKEKLVKIMNDCEDMYIESDDKNDNYLRWTQVGQSCCRKTTLYLYHPQFTR